MFKISNRNLFSGIDKWIFFSILLLITIGIFGVFSASTRPDEKYDILIKKHLIFCLIGVFILFCISRFSLKNVIITSVVFFL